MLGTKSSVDYRFLLRNEWDIFSHFLVQYKTYIQWEVCYLAAHTKIFKKSVSLNASIGRVLNSVPLQLHIPPGDNAAPAQR